MLLYFMEMYTFKIRVALSIHLSIKYAKSAPSVELPPAWVIPCLRHHTGLAACSLLSLSHFAHLNLTRCSKHQGRDSHEITWFVYALIALSAFRHKGSSFFFCMPLRKQGALQAEQENNVGFGKCQNLHYSLDGDFILLPSIFTLCHADSALWN